MDFKTLSIDETIWAIGSLAQINRLPFDKDLLVQGFPPPYRFDLLPDALAGLGFKTKLLRFTPPQFLQSAHQTSQAALSD